MTGASLAELESSYRSRYEDFRRLAAAITRDSEGARDVVQEAFAAAVRTRRSFGRTGPLDAWLLRIVVNTALNQCRGRRDEAALPPRERAAANEMREDGALGAAIAALPERQRLTLFLRYYADLDYEAIAAVLAIRPGTVGALLHRAHATLRRALEEVLL